MPHNGHMTQYELPAASPGYIKFAELVNQFVPSLGDMLLLTNSIADLHVELARDAVDDALDVAESPFRRIVDEQADEINSLYRQLDDLREQLATQKAVARANINADTVRGIDFAVDDPETLEFMKDTRKIDAIKRVRVKTGIGLKAAKDAVESTQVTLAVADFHCVDCF